MGMSDHDSELRILHAGNISGIVEALAGEFRSKYPDARVIREKGGSVDLARKAARPGESVDIVLTADYGNIVNFLYGQCADWYGEFATAAMVLAFTEKSRLFDRIDADNWHEILATPGIRIMGGDPDSDPGAYRRILIGKLAEKFYGRPGLAKKIEANTLGPDHGSHAIPMAKSGQVDYMFMYRPAVIAHGLKFIELPPEVNLSDPGHRDLYRTVDVMSAGVRIKGDVIAYGVTIPEDACHKDLAIAFLELLLGRTGTELLEASGFEPVRPLRGTGNVPPALRRFL